MKYVILLSLLFVGSLSAAITRSPSADGGATCSGHPCTHTVSCSNTTGLFTFNEVRDLARDRTNLQYGDKIYLMARSPDTTKACVLTNGVDEVVSFMGPFLGSSTDYIKVTTDQEAKLPPAGTRITGPYAYLMPTLNTPSALPVMYVGYGVVPNNRIWFEGLRYDNSLDGHAGGAFATGPMPYTDGSQRLLAPETILTAGVTGGVGTTTISVSPSPVHIPNGTVLEIASFYGGSRETLTVASTTSSSITFTSPVLTTHSSGDRVISSYVSTSQLPTDTIFSHLLIENTNQLRIQTNLLLGGRTTTVRDSQLKDTYMWNGDTQAISGIQGIGPYSITNNATIGHSENIMFGGDWPSLDVEVDGVTVEYNWLGKFKENHYIGSWQPSTHYWKSAIVYEGGAFYRAMQAGISGPTPPTWVTGATFLQTTDTGATRYDGVAGGVVWELYNGTKWPFKNNFEIKAGKNVTVRYNGINGFWDQYAHNSSQGFIIAIKANAQASYTGSCPNAATPIYPDCYRATTRDIIITKNKIEQDAAGTIVLTGGPSWNIKYAGHYEFTWNYIFNRNPNYEAVFLAAGSKDGGTGNAPLDDSRVYIEHNTFVSETANASATRGAVLHAEVSSAFPNFATTGANFIANGRIRYNIFHKGTGLVNAQGTGADNAAALKSMICTTCTTSQWDKNVAVGGNISALPGTNWNNCGAATTTGCSQDWTYVDPTYGALLRDYAKGLYDVKNTHGFAKRAVADQTDIGADMNDIPSINGLSVKATDRAVIFNYRLTKPIQSIPCVVEVNTRPDMLGSWVAELSDIATYYGHESDNHDEEPRNGDERFIVLGHTVPLTASTTYYYRLHCGGDMKYGSFTTASALTSTETRTVSRRIKHASAASMQVEFGTAYSRATDTITGSTAFANCTVGGWCTVSYTATKGVPTYFRWLEKSATGGTGTTLTTGRVRVD